MLSSSMDVCPICGTTPTVSQRWRLQVRCSCMRGPRASPEHERSGRWNSVVGYVGRVRRVHRGDLQSRR